MTQRGFHRLIHQKIQSQSHSFQISWNSGKADIVVFYRNTTFGFIEISKIYYTTPVGLGEALISTINVVIPSP